MAVEEELLPLHPPPAGACSAEVPLPGPDASAEEWASMFPLEQLPELPARSDDYSIEPWNGISVVAAMCAFLIVATHISVREAASHGPSGWSNPATVVTTLIWTWAGTAVLCVIYLLFGSNGEVARSAETCYPVPEEVVRCWRASESLSGLRNIPGADGRTYCVRCLLWRPAPRVADFPGHHCNTCQRCVVDFDHHCGVFGRCITVKNMPCFYLLNFMAAAGLVTAFYAHAFLQSGHLSVTSTPLPGSDAEVS